MLTETSYMIAMAVYLIAGLATCLVGSRWVARRPGWRLAWFLIGVALLLTPALPAPGMDTLAPAVVVAGFQLATGGVESAMHALRPLAITLSLACALALVGGLLFGRRGSR